SSAPLTLLSSLSGWPEQAGANFLILGHWDLRVSLKEVECVLSVDKKKSPGARPGRRMYN
ncbi:MAG: hypothetical protein WCF38_01295, partial [Pseudolabrys sp.]